MRPLPNDWITVLEWIERFLIQRNRHGDFFYPYRKHQDYLWCGKISAELTTQKSLLLPPFQKFSLSSHSQGYFPSPPPQGYFPPHPVQALSRRTIVLYLSAAIIFSCCISCFAFSSIVNNISGSSEPPPTEALSTSTLSTSTPSPQPSPRVFLNNVAPRVASPIHRGKGEVSEVAFSPEGHLLAVASSLGIHLYDTISLTEISFLSITATARSVAFSPDGRLLASGSEDSTIRLWEVQGGALVKPIQAHTATVWSVAFSPDGRLLASGSADRTIRLWEMPSGKLIRTLEGHEDAVQSVAFSPDGRLLASGSADRTIRLWEIPSGEPSRTLELILKTWPPGVYPRLGVSVLGVTSGHRKGPAPCHSERQRRI